MNEGTKQQRLETFQRLCREQGLPVTVQRRAILETVLDLDNHPTADQVHEAVHRHTEGISRATVYRTLETLVDLGVITKACHPGSVVRYDWRVEIHHHLICMRCDKVIDFSDERLDSLPLPDVSGQGFVLSDYRVQLRGICQDCSNEEKAES